MKRTKIEWTDFSANPLKYRDAEGRVVWACVKKSAGCANCYAESIAHHYDRGGPFTRAATEKLTPFLDEKDLKQILTAKTVGGLGVSGRRCFLGDMTDVFGEWVPDELLDRLFAVLALRSDVTFQLLTKRAERMAKYCNDAQTPYRVARQIDVLLVAEEMEGIEEEVVPLANYPGYLISNAGAVFSQNGSAVCLHCGADVGGIASKRYCGKKCKQNAAYHRKVGHAERFESSLKVLSPDEGEQGHQRVTLYRDGEQCRELVHRLVLAAFVRPPVEGEQGCHRDGNPRNNHICNLRWGTQSDNWEDRRRHGKGRSYSKLSPEEVEYVRTRLASGHPVSRLARKMGISDTQVRNIDRYNQWADAGRIEWPLPNCWKGTSVENQAAADERIPHLLRTPAAVRFLSCEPLLGPVDLLGVKWTAPNEHRVDVLRGGFWSQSLGFVNHSDMPGKADGMIGWIIVGGESGPGARPMQLEWVRSLVQQSKAAGTACFVKQLGACASDPVNGLAGAALRVPDEAAPLVSLRLKDKKGGNPDEWPAELRVRQFPAAPAA